MKEGKISRVEVVRGAPCGASWDAAKNLHGLLASEAIQQIGLEVQLLCTANPAGWDPFLKQSPVHIAGEVHSKALKDALDRDKPSKNMGLTKNASKTCHSIIH